MADNSDLEKMRKAASAFLDALGPAAAPAAPTPATPAAPAEQPATEPEQDEAGLQLEQNALIKEAFSKLNREHNTSHDFLSCKTCRSAFKEEIGKQGYDISDKFGALTIKPKPKKKE